MCALDGDVLPMWVACVHTLIFGQTDSKVGPLNHSGPPP